MPAVLAERTLDYLEDLPPYLQDSTDMRAVLDVCAREVVRFEEAVAKTRRNFYPHTADTMLPVFESLLQLSVEPPGRSMAERRASVLAFMQQLKTSGSGASWENSISQFVGQGWDYQEHIPGDDESPPVYIVNAAIPFQFEIARPDVPTLTPGIVGTLEPGDYGYTLTSFNLFGETDDSTETTATVEENGSVTLTWERVIGAMSYGVYRRDPGGELLRIATVPMSIGDEDVTFDDLGLPLGTETPPVRNSTESYAAGVARSLTRKITPAHISLTFEFGGGFIVGVSAIGDDKM